MFYRLNRVKHEAGKRDSLVAYLKSQEGTLSSIEGLQSVTIVGVSETESMGLAAYESEDHFNVAQEKIQEMMAGMMPLMTAPPDTDTGNVIWSFKK